MARIFFSDIQSVTLNYHTPKHITKKETITKCLHRYKYIGSLVTILVLRGIAFELGPREMGAAIIAVITA